MKTRILALAALVCALGTADVALASRHCTWSQQTNGSWWGTCVDERGVMYCVSCDSSGQNCTRVRCTR